ANRAAAGGGRKRDEGGDRRALHRAAAVSAACARGTHRMATVHLPSGWAAHTNGADRIVVNAARVDELLQSLVERFPALATELEQVAIAIDGQIFHHARYEPLGADSDVHLLPPVAGG